MKNYKILLIGCGQLGSRHLQAISSLNKVGEIHVVDIKKQAHDLGKARLKEVADYNPNIKFMWFTQLDEISADGDLCIISTLAKGRCDLIKQVAQKLGYKKFLIEKIVSQSIEEYNDLITFCEKEQIEVWVNCKSRTYEIHKYIKSKLDSDEQIVFSAVGGNHGLANNGIHSADLFHFYDGGTEIKHLGEQIDSKLHQSKRGNGFFDLSGSLYGCSDRGSIFILSFAGTHTAPDHISISSPSGRFIIDHVQKWAFESYAESGWRWCQMRIDENWAVSYMTKKFSLDILEHGSCTLPTLYDCLPAHQFILASLLPHFTRLLGKSNEMSCPVT